MNKETLTALQTERLSLTEQFQEFLQQLDLLCIPQLNSQLQRVLGEIPALHQELQTLMGVPLDRADLSSFFFQAEGFVRRLQTFKQSVMYFCGACGALRPVNPAVQRDARGLSDMADNLFRTAQNLVQFRSKFSQDAAVRRASERRVIQSPNRLSEASKLTDLREKAASLDKIQSTLESCFQPEPAPKRQVDNTSRPIREEPARETLVPQAFQTPTIGRENKIPVQREALVPMQQPEKPNPLSDNALLQRIDALEKRTLEMAKAAIAGLSAAEIVSMLSETQRKALLQELLK